MSLKEAEEIIKNDPWMMECLRVVQTLKLHDWYIAAGFVRNKIWDYLHDYRERTKLNDIDVVFYDPSDLDETYEHKLEEELYHLFPFEGWSVKNQARMHLRNNHNSYKNSFDAISHWVETPTCVGVTVLEEKEIEIIAPHGIEHNFNLTVTPNPTIAYPKGMYRDRIKSKKWPEIWPKLKISWG